MERDRWNRRVVGVSRSEPHSFHSLVSFIFLWKAPVLSVRCDRFGCHAVDIYTYILDIVRLCHLELFSIWMACHGNAAWIPSDGEEPFSDAVGGRAHVDRKNKPETDDGMGKMFFFPQLGQKKKEEEENQGKEGDKWEEKIFFRNENSMVEWIFRPHGYSLPTERLGCSVVTSRAWEISTTFHLRRCSPTIRQCLTNAHFLPLLSVWKMMVFS